MMKYSHGRCTKCGKEAPLKNGKCIDCNHGSESNTFNDIFGIFL